MVLKRARRGILRSAGGFLPGPLSKWSTMMTAVIGALVLLGYGQTIAGLTIGLLLVGAVWTSEMIGAFTSTSEALAKHATVSLAYAAFICLGVGGLHENRTASGTDIEWLSLGVLVLAAWCINAQPQMLAVEPVTGANFRGQPGAVRGPRLRIRGLSRILWPGIGLAILFAVTPTGEWVTAAIVFVVAGFTSWPVGQALRYAELSRWRPMREIRRVRPAFVIAWASNLVYQVTMWEQYLKLANKPYIIVTLNPDTVSELAAETDAIIVSPTERTQAAVDEILPASARTAFFVQNASDNKFILSHKEITSVWLHHGDSDKVANRRQSHDDYDVLFVAGQGAIDRYRRSDVQIPEEKFRIVGRPQTSEISVARAPLREMSDPKILYAPTWYGKSEEVNYSSLTAGREIVTSLLARGVTVIFRPHPASSQREDHRDLIAEIRDILRNDSEQTGRGHMWGDEVTSPGRLIATINASDGMIADVSGVVTDYMQSGKPYAMVAMRSSAEEFKREIPTSCGAYVIDNAPESLKSALDDMLGDDSLAETRWSRRSYYLGGFEGHESVETFLDEVSKVIG